jgi:hypothetical protein
MLALLPVLYIIYNHDVYFFRKFSTKMWYISFEEFDINLKCSAMFGDMFYDKPTITIVMKRAMKRLRTVDVHVSDVVAALQAQGVSITRARFDDLLLMRPERDISASCDLFASVIAVMFMFHAQALTTAEFFTLAIAMRIPISQYVGYMRYFPAEEWRQCMRDYGLDMTAVTNSQSLIGRDVELSQWHDAAVAQQNIAICGPPGIGKTVFGHALLRAYETAHGKRAYMMSGRSIHSFADFVRQLAQILGVATLVPELVQAQLQHVVQREQPYLLITEIDDIQAMTPAVFVHAVHDAFPAVRCIVTAKDFHASGYVAMQLTPLHHHHAQAAACQLLRRQRVIQALPVPTDSEVMQRCTHTDGLPLAIMLAAAAAYSATQPFQLSDEIQRRMDVLSPIQMRLLLLLYHWPTGVTYRFLLLMQQQLGVRDTVHVQRMIDDLVTQQLLIVRAVNDREIYVLHELIALQLARRITPDTLLSSYYDVVNALMHVDWRWEDTFDDASQAITVAEMLLVYDIIVHLVAQQHYVPAAQLLTHWHGVWRRFGFVHHMRPLIEACLQQGTDGMHPYRTELDYLLGCVMLDGGEVEQGIAHCEALLQGVTHTPLLWARISYDLVYAHVLYVRQLTTAKRVQLQAQLDMAKQIFVDHVMPAWQARVVQLIGMLAWHSGEFGSALEMNDQALRAHQHHTNTVATFDTLLQRGIILTSMGDFRSARNYLRQARRGFAQHALLSATAQCSIWLCYGAIFTGDAQTARMHIVQMLADGEHCVSLVTVLAFLDCVAAYIALSTPDLPDAHQLYALVTQYRQDAGIARDAQISASLPHYSVDQPAMRNHSPVFEAHMPLARVVTLVMHQFYP